MFALDASAVAKCVMRMANQIADRHRGIENLAIIGIVRRGAILAERIATLLNQGGELRVRVGTLDISSYRDDGKGDPGDPRLIGRYIPFQLDDRHVVLVDDVLYTGRTARAALAALTDLGRPESVALGVLIDRDKREVPIRADYLGWSGSVAFSQEQRVYVRLRELDGIDEVVIGERQ